MEEKYDFVETLIGLWFHRQPHYACAFAKKYYDYALFVDINGEHGLMVKLLFKGYNIEIPRIEDKFWGNEYWIIDFEKLNRHDR